MSTLNAMGYLKSVKKRGYREWNQQFMETVLGLSAPENGMIPCPWERVLITRLLPFLPLALSVLIVTRVQSEIDKLT